MALILALIGIPLIIGLGLFFAGCLTVATISAIFSMAAVAFIPMACFIFVLWMITDSILLSLIIASVFWSVVLLIPDKDAKAN